MGGLNFSSMLGPIGATAGFALGGPAGAAVGYSLGAGVSSSMNSADAIQAQKNANADNVALQRETNDQSIELANTAHQREVADLRAAGLNPILSAGGSGSFTPSLSAPQVESLSPTLINSARQGADQHQVSINAAQAISSMRLQRSQADVNNATVAKIDQDRDTAASQADLNSAQTAKIVSETPALREEAKVKEWEARDRQSRPEWLKQTGQGWHDFWDTAWSPVSGLLKGVFK